MPRKTMQQRIDRAVEAATRALEDRFATTLADISFRIGQAYEVEQRGTVGGGPVFAEDLRLLGRHFLAGYVLNNNSPAAGSIAWVDLHMVYDGVNYDITNGNTANRYVWWSPATTPTTLQSSNTKPVLAQGEVLVFMNASGTARVMLSDTNTSLPSVLADGSVDRSAIVANAIGNGQLDTNAVDSRTIGNGAVGNDQLGSNAVGVGKIADGAVNTAAKLANGIVGNTQLADNAVSGTKVANGGIGAGKLGTGAVSAAGQIANGIVGNTQLADNAVSGNKVANGGVGAGKLANGAVSAGTQIAAGVVDASRLNVLRHFLL